MIPNFGANSILGDVILLLLWALWLAILFRALISWVSPDPRNPIVQILAAITDPVLQPIRQIMPRTGTIDFTPLVALILLQVLIQLVQVSEI